MNSYTRLLLSGLLLLCVGCTSPTKNKNEGPPNIIIIFADDLGYGDLGSFGHPTLATPHLDKMAAEGIKLSQFYTAASVCTPSRAALMTGRLPIRNGMCSSKLRVLFPPSTSGLPASEITIAEGLKEVGYKTACIGKWHLGHNEGFFPRDNGFDYYFGIPYSNDMSPPQSEWSASSVYPPLPLMENDSVIETEPNQAFLTRRYTEKTLDFIKARGDKPFFIYFPHTFPHIPLYSAEPFKDSSLRGLYGDVVEEMDWSVGQIMATLQSEGIDENTLVIFTSDNGPWLVMKENGGSAGLFRQGKGSTWEGGIREPFIARWPGVIPAGITNTAISSTMDLLPTCFGLAGVDLPKDRFIDGKDLMPVLKNVQYALHDQQIFYLGAEIFAIRKGPWKLHYKTLTPYVGEPAEAHDPPLLYHLEFDPSEQNNLAGNHPDIIQEIEAIRQAHLDGLEVVPSELEKLSMDWP